VTYGQLPRHPRHEPDPGGPRAGVHRAARAVRREPEHVRGALRGRVAARLFATRARRYSTALAAALFGNDIPVSVVENLVEDDAAGTAPLSDTIGSANAPWGSRRTTPTNTSVPLVESDARYEYEPVLEWIAASVAPLGSEYQQRLRHGFANRWIDVYETPGKRSGAYSAPVYGVHSVHVC